MKLQVRINGNAPAWPAFLGQQSVYYKQTDPNSMGSASYSILASENNIVNWEVLIDAGHNTVPFLFQNGNRLPQAIILTHAHPDHILGVDWIVQSHRFSKNPGKLPVYCSQGVWEILMKTYGHIRNYTEHNVLLPGVETCIAETGSLRVSSYPVFHGSGATGASMLFFQDRNALPLLISGDMLCPLLRKADYKLISNAKVAIVDFNNRFPDPDSNHISFTPNQPDTEKISSRLIKWMESTKPETLFQPHRIYKNKATEQYLEELASELKSVADLPLSILDFCKYFSGLSVNLVHYFGYFDQLNYHQELLTSHDLQQWATKTAKAFGIVDSSFKVPDAGTMINL